MTSEIFFHILERRYFEVFSAKRHNFTQLVGVCQRVIYTHFMYEFLMMSGERFDPSLTSHSRSDGSCLMDEMSEAKTEQIGNRKSGAILEKTKILFSHLEKKM